ncbi:MAG: PKD domain-containing protein [Crocinitomicaceae bacterium]|nr:PKD domain-containing protein [Crocinitomicaceae bacterium]
MKTRLLASVGFSLLAFASIGQTRSTGVTQRSISEATPNQNSFQEYVEPRTEPARVPNTLINRAPCIDTLLFEDFQSQGIPATWTNLDLDMNADANGRPQDWFVTFDAQSTLPADTNWVAASSSWFNPLGIANNVLILDAVQPCASTVLRWDSAPFEGPTFMDGYEVRISTTGTNIADFTTTLFTAAESVNGTATPSAGTVHTSYNGTNGLLQTWEVSLGAYDNQTVYIAFFHDSDDDNLLHVDNIFMGLSVDYDLEATDFTTEPYYSTPLPHVTPRTFSTEVSLATGAPVTTPTASVDLFQGATSVFTNAPSAPTLNSGSSVTLTTTAYTPLAIDTYQAFSNVSGVETDPNLLNNSDSLTFVVSDSVYATADTLFDGALSIGTGSAGFLGNQYPVATADDLTSVTFTLSAPTVGDTIVGAVYDMIGANPNQVIATTDTLIITSANPAQYTLPIVGGGVTLTPGDYVVGLQESISGGLSLATSTEYYTPALAWVFFGGTWDNNENFGFLSTYLMEANFGPFCATATATYTESANALVVDFTDASSNADSWVWDFGDGNTSTQQNPTHTYAVDGTYTVCLIASSVCDADTVCTTITVTSCPIPVAGFTESINGTTVDFTDTSLDTDLWAWDFGDGNSSTQQNPTHTYTMDGTYTVCLVAISNCGGDTTCTTITVSNCTNPVAGYTETQSAGGVVDFTSTSTTTGLTTYSWDFGDGQTATSENPTNTYAANGTYTVCLTVSDSCGIDTLCNTINVNTIGIDENSLVDQLSIFPIPAQETMTISNLTSGEDFKLELLNNLGQIVKVIRTEGLETVQLDLSAVVDGYYHLRVSNSTMIGTRAVLIKH